MNTKASGATKTQGRLGLLAEIVRNAQLAWRLLWDPRVPLSTKLILPGIMGLYLLSPIDALPDVLLPLGQLDDIVVLLLGMGLFIELCPPDIVAEHRAALVQRAARSRREMEEAETIDAEYRVIE
ncbi:MAG: YkvA family protein [Anaerolineae bacterium]